MRRACSNAFLVLCVVLLPALAAAALADTVEEAAIMRELRAAATAAVGGRPPLCPATARLAGWRPEDSTHHCQWAQVACNTQQRVTNIDLAQLPVTSDGASPLTASGDGQLAGGGSVDSRDVDEVNRGPATSPGVLLPSLARLPVLKRLVFETCDLSSSSIPVEWGQPDAFPSLAGLIVHSRGFGGGSQLPDILPGALPALRLLDISLLGNASTFRPTLPPSWGASPKVLPSLQKLILQLPIVGPLPPQWSHGFAGLRLLWLSTEAVAGQGEPDLDSCRALAATAAGQPERMLPGAWAAGFPELRHMEINCLHLGGTLPAAWAAGGFPALETIRLAFNRLSGTLPPHFFANHPSLTTLELDSNRLSGTLPPEYAASWAHSLSLSDNALRGPAFPAAWLRPGAFAGLAKLSVGGNNQITGLLPDQLPWPAIVELFVHDTSMAGTVPAAWCRQPLAHSLRSLQAWGTGISPRLPRCLDGELKFTMHSKRPINGVVPVLASGAGGHATASAAAEEEAHVPHQSAARTVPLLALLALLVVAAAVAAAVGRARQQRGGRRRLSGGLELLAAQQVPHLGRDLRPEGEAEAAPLFPRNQLRQATLASVQRRARVRRQLQQALAGRSGGIELLQLAEVHAVLAHNLEGGQQSVAEHSGSSGSSSSLEHLSRQWGLCTDSLRLQPGELELTKGADGLPVVIGEGAHAVVMLGLLQGMEVAVKAFELADGVASRRMWQEVALLRDCVHERLVPLYGVAMSGNLLLLVQRLMHGGSLQLALQQAGKREALRWGASGRRVALDIAEGLAFLHARQTLHADLKPSNVLLSGSLRACLADLSMSRVLQGTACTAHGGTACYAAPEQLMGERCTLAADMYSLGVLLCELISQEPVVRRGGWSLPSPAQCPAAVVELIQACLSVDPAQRPTAEAAVQLLRQCEG